MEGGEPGARARVVLRRAGGEEERLGPVDERDVAAGDSLRLETPGGGGWGSS